MIDHGAVLIGFPNRSSSDSVRDLDLEHLAIERPSRCGGRGIAADPVVQSNDRRSNQLVAEIATQNRLLVKRLPQRFNVSGSHPLGPPRRGSGVASFAFKVQIAFPIPPNPNVADDPWP